MRRVLMDVTRPSCQSGCIVKRGKTATGNQRYDRQSADSFPQSAHLNPAYINTVSEFDL